MRIGLAANRLHHHDKHAALFRWLRACETWRREGVALATLDVSFISSTLILPRLPPLLEAGADVLVLVKPQFEVGRSQVGKGGIVRDPRLHQEAVARVSRKLLELGFSALAFVECCLPGAKGNREYFLHAVLRESR